jgi:2-dehydropantoate 2-reductase
MRSKTKIAVLGLGGVGGYFGGYLARHFEKSNIIDIIFIARGDNKMTLKNKGITLQTPEETFVAYPKLTSSDPSEIGTIDYLICCTKTYDLEQSLRQYIPCIKNETVLISLQNGVEGADIIKQICPENEVLDGGAYIISSLVKPGIVKKTSKFEKIFFGTQAQKTVRQVKLAKILLAAGIDASLSKNIKTVLWEKFLLISTMATITSFLNISIGAILVADKNMELLLSLMNELKAVGEANGTLFSADIIHKTLNIMSAMPFETTSSLQRDFQTGKKTEVDTLVGYVVRAGKQLKIPTPLYEMMYEKLKGSDTVKFPLGSF